MSTIITSNENIPVQTHMKTYTYTKQRVRTGDEKRVSSDVWLFEFVFPVTGLVCRERRMAGRNMGHSLCLLFSLPCLEMALHVWVRVRTQYIDGNAGAWALYR